MVTANQAEHAVRYCILLLCVLSSTYLGAQCGITVDAGPDLSICGTGNTGTLSGTVVGNFTDFQWTPAAGLSNPGSLTPTVNTPGIYTLTATGPSNINLIANGDFESGPVGFSSDYALSAIPILNGTYTTVVSPQLVVSTFPPCDDHTFGNGTGQMLLVNGDGIPGENVWCQTIPVSPNTNYDLSAWVSTLVPIGLAQLQFSINGQLLGGSVSPTSTPCEWVPFSASWNSGGSTSATVCIVTQSGSGFGNDFVLDDIEMYGECQVLDEVAVEFLPEPVVNVQAFRCLGDCFLIGNTPYCGSGDYSQAIPAANGCDSTVNLQLTVLEAIAVVLPPDTLSCYNDFVVELDASPSTVSPFTTYTWSGPNGFSSTLQNPIVTNPGTYTLEVTSSAGGLLCSGLATVTVTEQANQPAADAGPDVTLGCGVDEARLDGMVSDTGALISYNWVGPNGFYSEDISPILSDTGLYILEAFDTLSGCSSLDSTVVSQEGNALSLSLSADTLNCREPAATLTAVPDSSAADFVWSGPNDFTDSLPSTTVTVPGWYTFRQSDSTGCLVADSVFVAADTLLPAFDIAPLVLSCNQSMDSLIVLGLSAYDSLQWSGPSGFSGTGESVVVSAAGLYRLQVTAENGCQARDSVLVTGDFSVPDIFTFGAALDCGDNMVTIGATAVDTVLEWSWAGPDGFSSNTDTVAVTAIGSYVVSARGSNGCVAMDTVRVEPGQGLPQLSAAGGTVTCDNPIVTLSGNATDGASLSWSGPAGFTSTDSNPIVDQPGAYTLTATLSANCTVDTIVIVTADTLPPSLSIQTDTISCNQPNVSLQANVNGAVSNWSWSGPAGFNSSDSTAVVSLAGLYQIVVEGVNGCTDAVTLEVIADTLAPDVQLTADTLSCFQPVASLTAVAPAAGSFMWTGPGGFSSLAQDTSTLIGGTYWLQATAANGCISLDSIEVESDLESPELTVANDTLDCVQIAVTLTAASNIPVTYSWTGPNGFSASQPEAVVTEPGDYTLQAEAANGCSDTVTLNIVQDTLTPALQIAADTLTCSTTVSTLTANAPGAQTIFWSGPAGFEATGTTALTTIPGRYVVSAIAENGCSAQDSIDIIADTAPPGLVVFGDTLDCNSPLATLQSTVTTQVSYAWSGPGAYTSTDAQPSVSAAGMYILTVTASNGCNAMDTAIVLADTLLPALQLEADTISCNMPVGTLTATAPAAQSFTWLGPSGFSGVGPEVTISEPGWYEITITAGNGCSAQDSIQVFEALDPPALQLSADTLTCNTTMSILNAVSPDAVSFSWMGPGGFSADMATAATTAPGWYIISTTAANGCTAQDSIQVVVDQAAPELVVADDTISCTEPLVELQSSVTTEVSYAWSGPEMYTSQEVQPVVGVAGIYTLTVTAQNGCSSSDTATVVADTLTPDIQLFADTLSCLQPQVQLIAVSTTPSLLYSWSGPDGFSSIEAEPTVTEPGGYELTVTAFNGCSQVVVVQVEADTVRPQLQATTDTITCADPEAQLTGDTDGVGGEPLWSGPNGFIQAGQQVSVALGGTYTFTYTAANGCQDSIQVEVMVDTLKPQLSVEDLVLNCRQNQAPLPASLQSQSDVVLSWSGPDAFSASELQPVVLESGVYQLVVIDPANGCLDSASLSVTLDTLRPVVSVLPPEELGCLADTVSLVGMGSAGDADLSFSWSTNEGAFGGSTSNPNVSAVAQGLYVLTVENLDNGCSATDSVVVLEIINVPQEIDLLVFPPYCPGSTGQVSITSVQGGTPPYWFALDGSPFFEMDTLGPLLPGEYELEVEDANGCRSSQSFSIPQPPTLELELPAALVLRFSDIYQIEPVINFPESIITSVSWSPADFLSCSDCLRPVLEQPLNDAVYTATITTGEGCEVSAQLRLNVLKDRRVYLPGAFSPGNGDGRNDYFTVFAAPNEVTQIRRLAVFDRWGGQVFEKLDFLPNLPAQGWDGNSRGKAAAAGLYVFWAEVEFSDGQTEFIKGEVLLLR